MGSYYKLLKMLITLAAATCRSRLHSLFMEKVPFARVSMSGSIQQCGTLRRHVYNVPRPPNLALKVQLLFTAHTAEICSRGTIERSIAYRYHSTECLLNH